MQKIEHRPYSNQELEALGFQRTGKKKETSFGDYTLVSKANNSYIPEGMKPEDYFCYLYGTTVKCMKSLRDTGQTSSGMTVSGKQGESANGNIKTNDDLLDVRLIFHQFWKGSKKKPEEEYLARVYYLACAFISSVMDFVGNFNLRHYNKVYNCRSLSEIAYQLNQNQFRKKFHCDTVTIPHEKLSEYEKKYANRYEIRKDGKYIRFVDTKSENGDNTIATAHHLDDEENALVDNDETKEPPRVIIKKRNTTVPADTIDKEARLEEIEKFNEQAKDTIPKKEMREREEVLRTQIGEHIKHVRNHTCQICGAEGFRQKDGTLYAEAHHIIPLAKQRPGSDCSENIIVVCPTCHRKLHHAKHEYIPNETNPESVVINEKQFPIERNTITELRKITAER